MKYHKQLFKHDPPDSYGDCFRTCIACLLDLQPLDVPNFFETTNVEDAWQQIDDHLKIVGYRYILIACHEKTTAEVLTTTHATMRDVPFILFGNNHAVVGLNDRIIHDPSWLNVRIDRPEFVMILVPFRYVEG